MIKINGYEFKKFPNGESNLVRNSDSFNWDYEEKVYLKYEGDEDLFRLLLIKKHLDNCSDFKKVLYISYMPYSRMDRSEGDNCFSLKYVCEFINNLKFDRVYVLEAHSNVTLALLNNVEHVLGTERLLPDTMAKLNFGQDGDYVVFPDYGALNRLKNVNFDDDKLLVANKKRDFETGKIKSLEIIGNPSNKPKRALIIDDLTSYGGTFVQCSKELYKLGFEEVYLQVVHAENVFKDGELFDFVDGIFTTTSIYNPSPSVNFQDGKVYFKKWEEVINEF